MLRANLIAPPGIEDRLQCNLAADLDVAPIVRLGTVEFRYFNGTLDPEVLALYIDIVYALAELSERAGPFAATDAAGLASVLPASFDDFLAALASVDFALRD